MATKTIVRYHPPSPLIGRRELTPADFETLGIFTQEKVLHFDQERNWWLDAEAAGISKEALQWFEDSTEFSVQRQEVKGKQDPEAERLKAAYDASLGSGPQPVVEGETTSEAGSTGASLTTESTAKV